MFMIEKEHVNSLMNHRNKKPQSKFIIYQNLSYMKKNEN